MDVADGSCFVAASLADHPAHATPFSIPVYEPLISGVDLNGRKAPGIIRWPRARPSARERPLCLLGLWGAVQPTQWN